MRPREEDVEEEEEDPQMVLVNDHLQLSIRMERENGQKMMISISQIRSIFIFHNLNPSLIQEDPLEDISLETLEKIDKAGKSQDKKDSEVVTVNRNSSQKIRNLIN